jgi:glycosyltransferase involved in cell wall biosynthesis
LLIAGEGDTEPVDAEIKRRGLEDTVIRTGFVTDEDFYRYLSIVDIFVNLRYPSMGESSATLLQAFSLSKACVITNDAWFAEIPDTCAVKIHADEQEIDELTDALAGLASDPDRRARLGVNARAYLEAQYAPAKVAQDYLAMADQVMSRRVRTGTAPHIASVDPDAAPQPGAQRTWAQDYLVARVLRALPASGT